MTDQGISKNDDFSPSDALIGIIDSHNVPIIDTYLNFILEAWILKYMAVEVLFLIGDTKICAINQHKTVLPRAATETFYSHR